MIKPQIIEVADRLRSDLGDIDRELVALCGHTSGEATSNIMLSHRHLEDSRMRLGKAIQALEGGVSILDNPRVKALIAEIRNSGS